LMFGPSEPNGRERTEDPNDPSIFELLPRQLGLRLDSIRGPLDMYVIDHVERPTSNGAARTAAPAAGQRFTAVTMKPCVPGATPSGPGGRGGAGNVNAIASPGSLAIDCTTVERLIDTAYVFFGEPLLNESGPPKAIAPRLKGGPSWLRSEKFSIEATAEGGADRKTMMGPMLRAFLEERLQLTLHRDTEEMPAYALSVAKGGLKMKPIGSDAECKPECGSVHRGGTTSQLVLELGGMELEVLMVVLKLDRHVIDRTGIPANARFNIHLEYPEDATFADAVPAPSLFRAVEQQLGLKLDPIKAQHGVVVIDKVAHP